MALLRSEGHQVMIQVQSLCADAWHQSTVKAEAKKRRDGWNQCVKDMWKTAPNKIYKWIRGTIVVWDLAAMMMDTPTHHTTLLG
eukprot:4104714-Amphidinium_carterae.1